MGIKRKVWKRRRDGVRQRYWQDTKKRRSRSSPYAILTHEINEGREDMRVWKNVLDKARDKLRDETNPLERHRLSEEISTLKRNIREKQSKIDFYNKKFFTNNAR